MGKLSTSVGASTPRMSRLIRRMPPSPVTSTFTSQGVCTPSASSAVRTTFRIKDRSPSSTPGTSAEMMISCLGIID